MPGSSNNSSSFIPKRGPARRRNYQKAKGQVFIYSIITYSLLCAALIAAGILFFYENYLTSQLQAEVASLNQVSSSFSVEALAEVRELDITLERATDRVDNAASVAAILEGLDLATAEPIQIQLLTIERIGDEQFLLSGELLANSFDAALFQRRIYSATRDLFARVDITEVTVAEAATGEEAVPVNTGQTQLTFTASLDVPLTEVLFDPASLNVPTPAPVSSPAATSSDTTS